MRDVILKLQDEWAAGDIVPLKHQLGDAIKCVAAARGPTQSTTAEERAAV